MSKIPYFKKLINLDERNAAFVQWLRQNQRGGWTAAFEAIVNIPGNTLETLDFEDLVIIFTRLGPQEVPMENTDDLVAMFAGMSL